MLATNWTPTQIDLPLLDGREKMSFTAHTTGPYYRPSEWNIYWDEEVEWWYGDDIPIIYELMNAVEEEQNKELDRKIRILGEALNALEDMPSCHSQWYSRRDSWTRTLPGTEDEDEWPLHRVFAHFMLNPLPVEVSLALEKAEEDFDYESWINSKQYIKSLETYNFHRLLACKKFKSPHWVGECMGDIATTTVITAEGVARSDTQVPSERCVLYNTFLKERFKINTIIRTEFPYDKGNKAYAKASSPFGDVYIPYKFCGYIGQPGAPHLMTVALQDVGDGNRKANGYRLTCIYTH